MNARYLSRRSLVGLWAAMVGGAVLAACAPAAPTSGPAAKTTSAAKAATTAPTAKPVKNLQAPVRWWTRGTPDWQKAMQGINDAYLAAYPDRKVTLEVMPSDRYDDKVFTSAAAGTLADVFHSNSEMVPTFAAKGIILDLTSLLDNDATIKKDIWFDWAWVPALYNNKIWALTQKGNTSLTYYNKTLFDDAKVSYPKKEWTWADLVQSARALTKPGSQWGTWVFPWHIAVWENGGEIFSEDGQVCKLDQPAAYEAIQWVADLALKEKVGPNVSEQGAFGSLNPFMSGKVATYVAGESELGGFINSIKDFQWAATWIPKGKHLFSEGTSTTFPMNRGTKVLDAAWEFLKFLSGDIRAYEVLNKAGKLGIPPLKAAFDKLFLGTEPRPDVKEVLGEMARYNRVWMRNITSGAEVKTAVTQGLSRVWSGAETAEAACKALTTQVNEILAKQPR